MYEQLSVLIGPLLPNLQDLSWGADASINFVSRSPSFQLIECYVTPNLQSLTWSNHGYRKQDDWLALFAALPSRCPDLRNLDLSINLSTFDDFSLPVVIDQWKHLQRIEFVLSNSGHDPRPFSSELMAKLSSIPALHKLKLLTRTHNVYVASRGEDHQSCDPIRFHTLHTLDIDADQREQGFTLALLRDSVFHTLRHLRVLASPAIFRDLLSILHYSIPHDTLETFRFDGDCDLGPESQSTIGLKELRPLLKYRNLRDLHIRITIGIPYIGIIVEGAQVAIQLTDADWEVMARAWPHMQSLHIFGSGSMEIEPSFVGPSYRAFVHLVRHCPDIEDIGLFISEPSGLLDELDVLPSSVNVATLDFYHSKITDFSFMGSCIRRMFPHIGRVSILDQRPHCAFSLEEQVWADMLKTDILEYCIPLYEW